MVEGARLESEYTSKTYHGFESHTLRQISFPTSGFTACGFFAFMTIESCPGVLLYYRFFGVLPIVAGRME